VRETRGKMRGKKAIITENTEIRSTRRGRKGEEERPG